MEKTFCSRLSDVSENVFGEVFAVLNKRGQGFVSGSTLFNVFFVPHATFFLQCGQDVQSRLGKIKALLKQQGEAHLFCQARYNQQARERDENR